ncbi:MAG: DUF2911 domain-containing protein [Bacteroidota bacterium]
MKKIIFGLALSAGLVCSYAQPIVTPQPSTTQTIKQNFSVGSIELSYSRPNIKGRKVFGDLVPFGKVWRTGANNATTLTFTDDVMIGGKDVKAGKYGLLSIPGATEWTLIITKDLNVTSPSAYKQENDVVRVSCKPTQISQTIETFTIMFANVTNSSTDLQILWDNTVAVLPISTNTDAKVMGQIDNIFNKDNKPYFAAASYYYDNGKDLTQAKAWVDRAIADPANAKAFWMTMLKARIQEKMGDKSGAKNSAEKTIALATEAKNDDYIKMATDLMKKL